LAFISILRTFFNNSLRSIVLIDESDQKQLTEN